MASTKVFRTVELLENVLLDLSIKDILISAQRVNKVFHATVLGSTKLQQALFFKPLPGKPLNYEVYANDAREPMQWLDSLDDNMYHVVFANPFYHAFRETSPDAPHPYTLAHAFALAAAARPEASWRRMLVSQPPITTVLKNVFTRDPSESASVGFSGEHSSVSLDYLPVYHDRPQDDDIIFHGLTLGTIDLHTPEKGRIGGTYDRIVRVLGDDKWANAQSAREVKRVTKPKPGWLINKEGNMLDPDYDCGFEPGYADDDLSESELSEFEGYGSEARGLDSDQYLPSEDSSSDEEETSEDKDA